MKPTSACPSNQNLMRNHINSPTTQESFFKAYEPNAELQTSILLQMLKLKSFACIYIFIISITSLMPKSILENRGLIIAYDYERY
jgi:hypothetical protein